MIALTGKSKDPSDFGCIMLILPKGPATRLNPRISEPDIYEDPTDDSYGLETEPHVTVIYGIHDDEMTEDDESHLESLIEQFLSSKTEIVFDAITTFPSNSSDTPYDVLKYDVVPIQELMQLFDDIESAIPNTQTFPEYHPHSTIAYVMAGTGELYVEDDTYSIMTAQYIKRTKQDGTVLYYI